MMREHAEPPVVMSGMHWRSHGPSCRRCAGVPMSAMHWRFASGRIKRMTGPNRRAGPVVLLLCVSLLFACARANTAPATPTAMPMPTTPAPTGTPVPPATRTEPAPTSSATAPGPTAVGPTPAAAAPILAGYYAGWGAGRYPIAALPADQLSVLIYAFANVSAGGECVPEDPKQDDPNWAALQTLRQQHPALKVMISVGGWSQSGLFSDVAATAAARARFAASCAAFIQAHGFDGLDVDWEFPVSGGLPGNHYRPDDGQNFTLLLAELRRALDAQGQADGRHYRLTIAAPAGPSEYRHLELKGLAALLDWFNLMTYDFYTAASPTTNFIAALYPSSTDPDPVRRQTHNADAAVRAYLAAVVPAGKLLLGTSLYGRGWQGVPPANDGLYQSDRGPASGPATGGYASDGVLAYPDLESHFINAGGYARHFSAEAKAPWLYNPAAQIFISYDDPESLGDKADYALAHGLGGMMFWELSLDDQQHALVSALHSRLNP